LRGEKIKDTLSRRVGVKEEEEDKSKINII